MARIHRSQGACPVCGRGCARTVHQIAGLQREVFRCDRHGRMEYGTEEPLGEFVARMTPTSAALPGGIPLIA